MEQKTPNDMHAELRALRERVALLERRRVARPPRRRTRVPTALTLAFVLALVPYTVLAVSFSDQGSFSPAYADDIRALADAGITLGFDDPNSDDLDDRLFAPQLGVTRQEMATFLARTAGLGAHPPVANAARLGGEPVGAYARINGSPTFADLTVSGTVRQAYAPGTASRATPLAFAFIKNDGTVLSGTPNASARFNNSLNWYEITIAGEQYLYSAYQTVVTVNSARVFVSTGSSEGKLLVIVTDAAGNPANPGDGFQFVTFKP